MTEVCEALTEIEAGKLKSSDSKVKDIYFQNINIVIEIQWMLPMWNFNDFKF